MPNPNLGQIREAISQAHTGDKEQLQAIFSDDNRLIVEAPAGYGKTKTMISKIAYVLASGNLPRPKKILALTFSVNAAYKIKKDVSDQLPKLLKSGEFHPARINDRVFVSNYHGFCRHVLKVYGYLIHESLKHIETVRAIDESNIEDMTNLNVGVTHDDAKEMSDFCEAIRDVKKEYINAHVRSYLRPVRSHLLPNNYITYNAIILFTLTLFHNHPELLKFYHKYFPIIIVDEFQDTNIISYGILRQLIGEQTRAIFVGDPLQRIYGFIGAIPNLMQSAKDQFGMREIKFKKNHRFKDNPQMMLLDKNIRLNAERPSAPDIDCNAVIDLKIFQDQSEEVRGVQEKIQDIVANDNSIKVAVLVRGRGLNVQGIMDRLEAEGIDYFYALYTDEDIPYINFHRECLNIFISHIKGNDRITKLNLKRFYSRVQEAHEKQDLPITQSLLDLLKIFLDRLTDDYYFLTNEDKIIFILDTLENRALKQQMEYVDKNVILSTVHGAKGLEWDYVILPDMEQYIFPNFPSLCGGCNFKHNRIIDGYCRLIYNNKIERQFLEELSVFYVSVTRAKKGVFFSSSQKRIHSSGQERNSYVSCLLSLPGIETGY